MVHTLGEIALALDAELLGDPDLPISGAGEPATAGSQDIALAFEPRYVADLAKGRARAALIAEGADWQTLGLAGAIVVQRPRLALSGVTRLLDPGLELSPGVHASAVVEDGTTLPTDVAIGAHAVISANVQIGAGTQIAPGVTIGRDAVIGENCILHSGVRIAQGANLGHRVRIHPNAVIGADGFSFVTPDKSSVERVRAGHMQAEAIGDQTWTRIHSIGGIEIGSDVEIGALTSIDRGTVRSTRIGRGTKIDNQVQIGHNCVVGEDCLFSGQVGIAGSVTIGNRVVLGGKVGVSDNISVGDDVVAGGASRIFTSVNAGSVVLGNPAVKMDSHLEMVKGLRRLPKLIREFKTLQKTVSKRAPKD